MARTGEFPVTALADPTATVVVAATGLYLIVFGGFCLLAPAVTGRFLLGFASSPALHYLELALRLLVGAAFIRLAPRLPGAIGFLALGWILIGTTVVLSVIPWTWHRHFAQRSVPRALRYLPLLAGLSLVAGAAILTALLLGQSTA